MSAGDTVCVATPAGKVRLVVQLDDHLPPDIVHAEHAWWFPESPGPDHGWRESCVNLLFNHEHFDPETGAESLKLSLCRIERLEDETGNYPSILAASSLP